MGLGPRAEGDGEVGKGDHGQKLLALNKFSQASNFPTIFKRRIKARGLVKLK
jgi:hypothetical protein